MAENMDGCNIQNVNAFQEGFLGWDEHRYKVHPRQAADDAILGRYTLHAEAKQGEANNVKVYTGTRYLPNPPAKEHNLEEDNLELLSAPRGMVVLEIVNPSVAQKAVPDWLLITHVVLMRVQGDFWTQVGAANGTYNRYIFYEPPARASDWTKLQTLREYAAQFNPRDNPLYAGNQQYLIAHSKKVKTMMDDLLRVLFELEFHGSAWHYLTADQILIDGIGQIWIFGIGLMTPYPVHRRPDQFGQVKAVPQTAMHPIPLVDAGAISLKTVMEEAKDKAAFQAMSVREMIDSKASHLDYDLSWMARLIQMLSGVSSKNDQRDEDMTLYDKGLHTAPGLFATHKDAYFRYMLSADALEKFIDYPTFEDPDYAAYTWMPDDPLDNFFNI